MELTLHEMSSLASFSDSVSDFTTSDRVEMLRDTVSRFNLNGIVHIFKGDAKSALLKELGGRPFDRILIDAPCSNTGVQRRRADARWRFSPDRLSELAETQSLILENMSGLLSSQGGRIVYSTCSLEEEENGAVVRYFLCGHPEFALSDERFSIPPISGTDGAYAAALDKRQGNASRGAAAW